MGSGHSALECEFCGEDDSRFGCCEAQRAKTKRREKEKRERQEYEDRAIENYAKLEAAAKLAARALHDLPTELPARTLKRIDDALAALLSAGVEP